MIIQLLQEYLPNNYGMNPNRVSVPAFIKTEPFTLTDNKACIDCHRQPNRTNRNDCNEEMLKVENNGQEVTVVHFEIYISQFDRTPANIHERCDYLLVDNTENHRKIVFCDLTCSDSKWVEPNKGEYPEGKRAKAKQQMLASIKALLNIPLLDTTILTFTERICLFGWREYGVPKVPVIAKRNHVIHNMEAFMTTPSSMANQLNQKKEILGHGFSFIQQKYPAVYHW